MHSIMQYIIVCQVVVSPEWLKHVRYRKVIIAFGRWKLLCCFWWIIAWHFFQQKNPFRRCFLRSHPHQLLNFDEIIVIYVLYSQCNAESLFAEIRNGTWNPRTSKAYCVRVWVVWRVCGIPKMYSFVSKRRVCPEKVIQRCVEYKKHGISGRII